jgi:hypothetical protein
MYGSTPAVALASIAGVPVATTAVLLPRWPVGNAAAVALDGTVVVALLRASLPHDAASVAPSANPTTHPSRRLLIP